MSYRALTLLLLGVACSSDREVTTPTDEIPLRTQIVAGVLEDSMLGLPLPGIRVLVGDSSTITDSSGRFTTRHRPGMIAIRVDNFSYESYRLPLQLISDNGMVQVRLRGQAPYITSCIFGPDVLTATVVDLQGRKTINRRGQTTMSLVVSGQSFRRDAHTWNWTPVDDLTWLAAVPLGSANPDSAVWRLEDADGHWRSARCVNQARPCNNCSSRH